MLKFRLLEEGDLLRRVEWMNDPRISFSMFYDLPVTEEKTRKWFDKVKNNECRRDFVLEDDNLIVAMSGLTSLDEVLKKVESYTIINPDTHGRGYGAMSLALHCAYGFRVWGLNKIWCHIAGDNIASQMMCKKVGWKEEGVLRRESLKNEEFSDLLYYGIIPEDLNMELYESCLQNCSYAVGLKK